MGVFFNGFKSIFLIFFMVNTSNITDDCVSI